MGLDSVELLMEVEKYFKIQIPDVEAEKIFTVMDMVNAVAQHRNIESNETSLRDTIFSTIKFSIKTSISINGEIQLIDKISDYLSIGDKEKWTDLENHIKLKIPRPDNYTSYGSKLSDKFKRLINWTPNYDWKAISFEQFVNAICANNYLTLITPDKIKSKHEIYIGVMGITVDKIGVEYYEILPDKSFTNDLGVD